MSFASAAAGTPMPPGPAAAAVAAAPGWPAGTRRAFVVAWVVFWLLLVTVAVQEHLRQGQPDVWRPLLWELSSCLVATLLLALAWPQVPRLDDRLATPGAWVLPPLALLLVAAPLFVVLVYGLRHGVYALVGQTYRHAPWAQLFVYETIKFSIFYLLFVAVIFGLRSFAAFHAERHRAERGLALAREAQLAQLAQQIEPHFLFNALDTVAAVIPTQPALAERLLLRLAALLRAATDLTRRPFVSVDDELNLLEGYAEIMGQRFADRVSITWSIDPAVRACRAPALILLPLLENAFRHGVERHRGPVAIDIRVGCVNAGRVPQVRASVACSAGHIEATAAPGVGLANVRQRLALAHGEAASLEVGPRAGGGVTATVAWPCES
ncbi:MAG: histidine kinase [Rubrivivax sp.]|nr:histidine kinase [Rubrivivax sp.]